jgi:hypothetical protein
LRGSIEVGEHRRPVNLAADEVPSLRNELLAPQRRDRAGSGNCKTELISQSLLPERMKRSISGKYIWKE